jgi:hypothetical protein
MKSGFTTDYAKGLSGFWNASGAVFALIMGVWAAIAGNWGVAALLIAAVPLGGYQALMRYRAGKWW